MTTRSGARLGGLRAPETGPARASTGEAADLAPPLRAALGRLDPELPLFGVRSMEERIDESLASRRIPLVLMGVFGTLALFLAVVGVYGALA